MLYGKLTSKVVLSAVTMDAIVFKQCSQVKVRVLRRLYITAIANVFLMHKSYLFIKTTAKTVYIALV